jgi:chromosome segregation ATPase
MVRRIFADILVLLSAIFLVLSLVGIGAILYYNEPLTREVTGRLIEVDQELALAEATLKSSEKELERALRLVDATETALQKLTQQTGTAENILETIQSTLDDRLLPELKTARGRIVEARTALESLQSVLTGISSFIPGVDLNLPGTIVQDLIASARSLDTEISNVEMLATQASTFVGDTSFILGGDLIETRESLETFLASIQDYETRVARWREQTAEVLEKAPRWIDQASIVLSLFLLWFAFSQWGLVVHGLTMHRGERAFVVVRRAPHHHNPLIKDAKDMELEE